MNEQVSPIQLFLLALPVVNATAVLFVPGLVGTTAGRDGWMAPILAPVVVLILIAIFRPMLRRWPQRTFIEVGREALGPWVGGALGILFAGWCLHTAAVVLREFGEVLSSTMLPLTPLTVILLLQVVAVAWISRNGLSALGRCAEIMIPINNVFIVIILLLATRDADFRHLQPVLEHGPGPVLRASIIPVAWFGELVLIAFLWPRLKQPRKGPVALAYACIWIVLVLSFGSAMAQANFGPVVPRLSLPTLVVARMISIGDFLERIEPLLIIVWVADNFVKLSVFHYVTCETIRQSLNLGRASVLAFPAAALMLVLAVAMFEHVTQMSDWLAHVLPLYAPFVEVGVPLICIGAGLLVGDRRSLGSR